MADERDWVTDRNGVTRRRKTHCKHGHKFDGTEAWHTNWRGFKCRVCRPCAKERMRRKRESPDFLKNCAEKAARWRRSHPAENRKRWESAFAKKRQILMDARAGGCIKCGEKHSWCLDFHHRAGTDKLGNIGEFRRFAIPKLLAEIAKCDVLCANCHRKHHGDEFQRRIERIKARHGRISEKNQNLQPSPR